MSKMAQAIMRLKKWGLSSEVNRNYQAHSVDKVILPRLGIQVPRSVDWRRKGVGNIRMEQAGGSCWSDTVFRNLVYLGMLNKSYLHVPLHELRLCDFRSAWATPFPTEPNPMEDLDPHAEPDISDPNISISGGRLEYAFEYAMRAGMFVLPKHREEGEEYRRIPLSGYLKLPPYNEDFLIAALAQQPVCCSMMVGVTFMMYTEGIYEGEVPNPYTENTTVGHAVNAIGYTDDYIVVEDQYCALSGIEGRYIHVRRDNGIGGTSGIAMRNYIPFMFEDTTELNYYLMSQGMMYNTTSIGCYCNKDLESIMENPMFPIEIKKAILARRIKGFIHHYPSETCEEDWPGVLDDDS